MRSKRSRQHRKRSSDNSTILDLLEVVSRKGWAPNCVEAERVGHPAACLLVFQNNQTVDPFFRRFLYAKRYATSTTNHTVAPTMSAAFNPS